jgi:hypothetical protein
LHKELETVETIDANHMQMARCRSKADARYRAIAGVLKQFVRKDLKQMKQTEAAASGAGVKLAAVDEPVQITSA